MNVTIIKTQCIKINEVDFTSSSIICNNRDSKSYNRTLSDIYSDINDKEFIMKHTKLNIRDISGYDKDNINDIKKGFQIMKDVGIAYQGVPANKCIQEIINMCKLRLIPLDMKIKLKNEELIDIKLQL